MNDTEILSEKNLPTTNSILIVDDQPANIKVLAGMLNRKNYKIKKAIDGETALIAAESNPPDLILLDILMPQMNGYEVCEKLKSNPQTKDIPVIFVSALNDVFDKIKAFKVGGVDYITKPFQEEEVMARINHQLTIKKQQKELEEERKLLELKQEILRQEIRQRKEAEAILYQSRALISSILNSSLDGIAALESVRNPKSGKIQDFRCIVINPIIAQFFNQEPEDLIGKLVFKRFINKINSNLFPAFVNVVKTGKALEKDISYYYQKEKKWCHFIAVKLGDGFSISVRDITERKKLELKLNKLATMDGLTEIANRRTFDKTLAREWKRCRREKQYLSLILCDVDYFKLYNDHYGHQTGDNCLIIVAKILSNLVQRSTDLVARYGGEEFGVILSNTDLDGATIIGKLIISQLQKQRISHLKSPIGEYVTISVGISSIIPTQKLSPEVLLKKADKALYEAKQQGRNRLVIKC